MRSERCRLCCWLGQRATRLLGRVFEAVLPEDLLRSAWSVRQRAGVPMRLWLLSLVTSASMLVCLSACEEIYCLVNRSHNALASIASRGGRCNRSSSRWLRKEVSCF